MKCKICNLCLKVTRLKNVSSLFYYCDLCGRVYKLESGKPVEDLTNSERVREQIRLHRIEVRGDF